MQITKARLKQIIKEELEATNEIVDVPAALGVDPSVLSPIPLVLMSYLQIAANLAPAAIAGGIAAMLVKMGKNQAEATKDAATIVRKAQKLTPAQARQIMAQSEKDAKEISSDLGAQRQPKK